ncbi:MAG: hypothetical protein DWQ01_01030 [Planctomycetota bacterium]|nr:MAG: hypothetical protein DWQ01_01030 [Planctomycetota bacterium]
MQGFSTKITMAAPPEQVFARASDLRKAPETMTAIVQLEVLNDGPIGKGTRFRETRRMFGKEATEEMEIVEFNAPHHYAVGAENHGCSYHTDLHFRPVNGGTEVEMVFKAKANTFMAKVMAFLMKPMMKMVMKSCRQDLEDLKAAIEAGKP